MKRNASAIWQKLAVPFRVAMQRTQTHVRTHLRTLKHHTQIPRVLNSWGAVDNRVIDRFEVVR